MNEYCEWMPWTFKNSYTIGCLPECDCYIGLLPDKCPHCNKKIIVYGHNPMFLEVNNETTK